MKLTDLPSPFYRVAVKAIVLDDQDRLLIGRAKDGGEWEIPGGGLEHDESIEGCLARELNEELGADIAQVGQVAFIYRAKSVFGWMVLRIAVPVKLKNFEFKFGDMAEAKLVTRGELQRVNFAEDEAAIKDYTELIWPK